MQPQSFKVLVRELQALCLDVATYKLDVYENNQLKDYEINLMTETQDNSGNQFLKDNVEKLNGNFKNLNSFSNETNFYNKNI